MIVVQHLNVMVDHDIAGEHRTQPLLVEGQGRLLARVHANRQTLEVEEDLGDVLLYPLDGGVLVKHSFDCDFGHRTTGHR